MNDEATRAVIAYMCATWRVEFTEAQQAVWEETLEPLLPAHARNAIRNLKDVTDIIPGHAEFLRAYKAAEHRASEQQALDAIRNDRTGSMSCLCDGTGIVMVDDTDGRGLVADRCPRCNALTPSDLHKAGCRCMQCHYGEAQAAEIRRGFKPKPNTIAGTDGVRSFRDKLGNVGVIPDEWGEF